MDANFCVRAETILGGTISRKTSVQPRARHNEISDQLANKICKDLGVPKVK
jgi:hypothetical protein